MTSREIERLANEYAVTKDLSIQGIRRSYDTIKIRQMLGWRPRPIEHSLIEMGESLIREGVV